MKMLIFLIIIFLTTSLHAQWEWQNPLPQGNSLKAVHFVDAEEGWAVGDYGTIIHTTNAGSTWDIVSLSVTSQFNDVFFIGTDTGWVAGTSVIYHTVDGGKNWTEQDVNGFLKSIYFINHYEGWAVGGQNVILHTQDGGSSWDRQECIAGGGYVDWNSVCFVNENKGWACGEEGYVIRTVNGGETWNSVYSGTDGNLSSIFFIDSNYGWSADPCTVYRTINGGNSWTGNSSNTCNITSIFFTDQLNGWICSRNEDILKTSDGGLTWEKTETDPTNQLHDLFFANGSVGFAVGLGGAILGYNNELNYWESKNRGFMGFMDGINSVYFVDQNEGWTIGGKLHHTTNGGKTWEEQTPEANINFYLFCFTDRYNGWVIGSDPGQIYRTRDRGEHWQKLYDFPDGNDIRFNSIFFADTLHGWLLDWYGLLFHTQDGGCSWEEQNCGLMVNQHAFYAFDSLKAWVAGDYGWLSKTEDGGMNWTTVQTGYENCQNYDIQFIDSLKGWMLDYNELITSNDGGLTWEKISGWGGVCFHFINRQEGWIGGTDEILHTIDGGFNWEAQDSPTRSSLHDIWFTDELNGWAVGSFGMILNTKNGGSGTVGIDNPGIRSPGSGDSWIPNPLTYSSTLKYELQKPALVRLEILNFSGQVIEELVDKRQSAGIHRITWEPTNLPAGIYLYRLILGTNQTTGKLILIK